MKTKLTLLLSLLALQSELQSLEDGLSPMQRRFFVLELLMHSLKGLRLFFRVR